MRLTAQTDFGLRLLMYVAAHRPRRVTIQEVSRNLDLSQAHLMRIAANLVSAGFLRSSRGRVGGLELAHEPNRITVGDVVRALEADVSLVECFPPRNGPCRLAPACRLKGVLERASQAFFEELDKATLEDLVDPNDQRLIRLIGAVT
ncbi:MAG TPA: Rrf2 family transcriptional regulator [Fimbriimonas sp.]|nr:Rrf2 family transcriptional regulator [Fimbriimonas sp.]